MAKKVENDQKLEVKANYEPNVLLDVEGSTSSDLEQMKKWAKIQANCAGGGSTSFRNNIAYRGQDLDKYGALTNYIISAQEAIQLSKVVYYRFGLVRNALDTMAEFTVRDVKFHSEKKTSKDILTGWADGIDLKSFLEQVALEYYRSGNCYIYRFESTLKKMPFNISSADLNPNSNTKIPVRYTLLDPGVVDVTGNGITGVPIYNIIIPASEIQQTIQHFKQDPRAIGQLPAEFREAINGYMGKGKVKTGNLIIKLDPANLIVINRKKQPYEMYATPFLSGAFEDLEFRQELRNMDKAVSRVVARILIHVKVGNDKFVASPSALNAIQSKLANPSTSTYLITDGTVEINQYFPDIGAMLDPKKYEPVTLDIATALGISPAVYGNATSNFSNNSLSIKVLVERIEDGKNKILRQFLIPEVLRVAKAFKLKNPNEIQPDIIGVDLSNEIEMKKLYTRLYEVGVLSPQSILQAFKDDTLPTYDEELKFQSETVKTRDEGFFEPVLNRGGDSPNSGRPSGVQNPEQTKQINTSPKGSKGTLIKAFSATEFSEAKNVAVNHIKNLLNLKELSGTQLTSVEDACAEFLITNNYSEKEFKNFIEELYKR